MPHIMLFEQKPELLKNVFDAPKYTNFVKLASDTAFGTFEQNIDKGKAEKKVRDKISAVLSLSDAPTEYEVKRALGNTVKREAFFEIVTDTIQDSLITGWGNTPFFSSYVETKNGVIGQRNEFYIPDKTELVISKIAGGNHDITRQRLGGGRNISLDTVLYGAKIYMESIRYLMQAEDWSAFIAKLSKAFTKAINGDLYSAFMNAGTKLPSPEKLNRTGELIPDKYSELMELVALVAAATGSEVDIIGTKTALSGLTKMGNVTTLSNSAKEDVYTTGVMKYFDGVPMIEVPQVVDRNLNFMVDNSKLLIMPKSIDKFVKLYYEGASTIREVSDSNTNMDGTLEYELSMRLGIAVITSVLFGTWTIGA